jgi:perosamine synthetase
VMNSYIGPRPAFPCRILLKGKEDRGNTVFPFNQKKCYYFFSARYALGAGIEALGLANNDTVLLPAYNCWTEIDPFLHLKINLVFYRIKKDLDIDLDDLLQKTSNNVKAILVTHFLGFPQPIDQIKGICSEKNLFLIEDCAHAFLSSYNGNPLGSYGDIAVFSFLKTLPVPNGGALLINNKNIEYKPNSKKPSRFATYFYAAELLRHGTRSDKHSLMESGQRILYRGFYLSVSLARFFLAGFRKLIDHDGLYLVRPDSYLFIENLRNWGISDVSRNILKGEDFEEIRIIRRRNFEYLLNHFLKNGRRTLPFKSLPNGVCPLFFPIIVESSVIRDNLYRVLKSRGVITHPWWNRFHPAVAWDEFPDEVYLKERLLGLPIHQGLTFDHLEQVIREFEEAYRII